jgi:putative adhesin
MTATDTAPTIERRIGANGRLTVRLADWDAEIHGVDGDTARVWNASGGSLPGDLQVDSDADGITVRQYDKAGLTLVLGRRSRGIRLAIEVPKQAAVSIQTASGDAQASNLRGPIAARTASGDLLLVNVNGDVQAETVSGDVAIRLDGPTGLAVKTVSGDAIVDGGRVERLSYTTTSGDLRITSELGSGPHAIATVSGDAIVTTRNGIRVSAQTVAGDLSSDLPHTSEGRAGRRSLIVGDGTAAVQFRSVSGDLRVVGPSTGDHLEIPMPPARPAPPTPEQALVADAAAAQLDAELAAANAEIEAANAEIQAANAVIDADGEEAASDPGGQARLEVLRALERGEIGVDEATKQLADLDGQADV